MPPLDSDPFAILADPPPAAPTAIATRDTAIANDPFGILADPPPLSDAKAANDPFAILNEPPLAPQRGPPVDIENIGLPQGPTEPQVIGGPVLGDFPPRPVWPGDYSPGLEERMLPSLPGTRREPAGPPVPPTFEQQAPVMSAITRGWQETPPILPPEAQAVLDRWGLGGDVHVLNGAFAALNALMQGGIEASVQAGRQLGLPEALVRDLGGAAESAGMTGAPHIPHAPAEMRVPPREALGPRPSVTVEAVPTPEAAPAPPGPFTPPPPAPPGVVPAEPPPVPRPDMAPPPPAPPGVVPIEPPPVPRPDMAPPPAAPPGVPAVEPAPPPARFPEPVETRVAPPVSPPPDTVAAPGRGEPAPAPGVRPEVAPVEPRVPDTLEPGARPADTSAPAEPVRVAPVEAAKAPEPARPVAHLPPPAEGTQRLYHGGSDATSGGGRWLSPDYDYARGYADKSGGDVWYVDVPVDHPALQAATDYNAVAGTTMRPPIHAFEAPPEIAQQLRQVEPPPAEPKPAPRAAAPQAPEAVTTEAGKRPVSAAEMTALEGTANRTQQALAKAERDRTTPEATLDRLRQTAQEARAARDAAEGPPAQPKRTTFVPGGTGPEIAAARAADEARYKRDTAAYPAATEAHQALVDRRMHVEGEAPVGEPRAANRIFRDQTSIVDGRDLNGSRWIGTGHALVRDDVLAKPAADALKRKGTTARTLDPGAIDRVVKPETGADYRPVTWERAVRGDGRDMVVGSLPGGQRVVLARPIFDTLSAAIKKHGGQMVADNRAKGADQRVLVRNPKGETVAVGMPLRTPHATATVWGTGKPPEKAAPAPPKSTPAPKAEPKAAEPQVRDRQVISNELTQTNRRLSTVKGQISRATNADREVPQQLIDRRRELVSQVAALEREYARAEPPKTEPPKTEAPKAAERKEPLTADRAQALSGVGRRERATQQANRLLPTDAGSGTTARPSRYFSVFRDAGHDPAEIVNRPLPEQYVIARKQVQDALGFKDITRDPNASWRQSVDQLQDAYQNLHVMGHAYGVPAKTLTLDGTLSLNFAPRKGTGFLGAYDPKTRTIHLSGRANSFAHEYAHALDHFLMDKLRSTGAGYASDQTLARGVTTRMVANPETARAFSGVLHALLGDKAELAPHLFDFMIQADGELPRAPGERITQREANARAAMLDMVRNDPSEYLRRSQQFANLTGSDYWTRVHELFARAFESVTSDLVTEHDPHAVQEFITRGERAYLADSDASERLRQAYPKGDNRARIRTEMVNLIQTMGREAVLGGGEAAKNPGYLDMVNPKYYVDRTVPPEQRGVFGRLKGLAHDMVGRDVEAVKRAVTEPTQLPARVGDALELGPGGAMRDIPTRWKRLLLNTTGGQMIINERKYTGEARAALADIRKSMVTREGAGELYRGTYGKEVAQDIDRNMARLAGNIERTGPPLTEGEYRQLNAVLRAGDQGPPPNVSKRVQDLAAEMRRHYNDRLYEANQAGLDIDASVEPYVHRAFVHEAVQGKPQEFRQQAARAYADQFDQLLTNAENRTAESAAALKVAEENAAKKRAEADALKGKPGVVEARKAAAQAEREAAKLRRAHGATMAEIMKEAGLDPQEDRQASRSAYAQAKAQQLWTRVIAGDAENFGSFGPTSSFRQERVLPASADVHLRDFYEPNPIKAMVEYIHDSSNKIEFAKQFGADHSILQGQLDRAANAGVTHEDIQDTKRLIQMMTGQTGGAASTSNLRKTLNFVSATGQMMTMARSPLASIPEPLLAAFHAHSPAALGKLFRAVIDDVGNTADGMRRGELADAIGEITQRTLNDSLAQKLGDFTTEKNSWAGKLSRYYYNIWLTRLDNMSRRVTVAPAEWYVGKLLDRVMEGATSPKGEPAGFRSRFSQQKLNELGISADEAPGVHAWLNDPVRRGAVTADQLESPEGQLYRTALGRFIEMTVTRPTRADVPELALQGPMGQLAYGLTRFTTAVARNTVLKAVNEFRAQDSWTDAGRTALQNSINYMPYVLATYLMMQTRRAIFGYSGDPEQDRQQSNALDAASLLSSTGTFGTADPAVNAVAGLRYHRELSAQSSGALLGTWMRALQWITEGAVAHTVGTPTNAIDRNAVRGLHMLAQVPLGMLFAEVPGAPALYPGYAYLTSPRAGGQLADVVAGPKESRGGGRVGGAPPRPARPQAPARPSH